MTYRYVHEEWNRRVLRVINLMLIAYVTPLWMQLLYLGEMADHSGMTSAFRVPVHPVTWLMRQFVRFVGWLVSLLPRSDVYEQTASTVDQFQQGTMDGSNSILVIILTAIWETIIAFYRLVVSSRLSICVSGSIVPSGQPPWMSKHISPGRGHANGIRLQEHQSQIGCPQSIRHRQPEFAVPISDSSREERGMVICNRV